MFRGRDKLVIVAALVIAFAVTVVAWVASYVRLCAAELQDAPRGVYRIQIARGAIVMSYARWLDDNIANVNGPPPKFTWRFWSGPGRHGLPSSWDPARTDWTRFSVMIILVFPRGTFEPAWQGIAELCGGKCGVSGIRIAHGHVALLVLAVAAIPLVTKIKRQRRVRRGLCEACGYSLRASPDRCPECGAIAARNR
jgi:hypothetical protein